MSEWHRFRQVFWVVLQLLLAWTRVRNRKLRGPFQLLHPTQGMYVCPQACPGGLTRGMYVRVDLAKTHVDFGNYQFGIG